MSKKTKGPPETAPAKIALSEPDTTAAAPAKAKGKGKGPPRAAGKAVPKDVLKKPAAAKPTELDPKVRPTMPYFSEASPMPIVLWNGGKITASFPKEGFRCFAYAHRDPNPVDKVVRWYDMKKKQLKDAWETCLDMIVAARKAEAEMFEHGVADGHE